MLPELSGARLAAPQGKPFGAMSYLLLFFFLRLRFRPNQRSGDRRQQHNPDNAQGGSGWNVVDFFSQGRARIKANRVKCGCHDFREQRQEHLQADESQHKAETDFEVMKFFEYACEQEIERAQSENRDNVRGVDDESIGSDAKNCGNRINREDEIGNFDHDQHQQHQRAHPLAVDDGEEFSSLIMADDRNITRYEPDDWIVFRLDFFLTAAQHLNAGVDKEGAEDIDDPVKAIDEGGSRENHRHAHHERAEHSPIQNSMLIFRRDFEVRKDQQEDEKVIDGKREFD